MLTEFLQSSVPITYTRTRTVKLNTRVLRERRIIAALKDEPQADMFRVLRTKVLKTMRANGWHSLAITGATPGVGKSMVAVNLAIALAMEVNQTVLLVDADLRRPSIAWHLGFEVQFGLLDYLVDAVPLEDVFVNPGIQRLVVMPGRGSTRNSSELLASPKMVELVEDLKARYKSRIVLFDLPPILAADDALLFMPFFDCTLLVVEDGKSTEDDVRRSLQLLEGTNVVGTVLNKADKIERGDAYLYEHY
jgi:capsular exopolysaccharide synthesis family protein